MRLQDKAPDGTVPKEKPRDVAPHAAQVMVPPPAPPPSPSQSPSPLPASTPGSNRSHTIGSSHPFASPPRPPSNTARAPISRIKCGSLLRKLQLLWRSRVLWTFQARVAHQNEDERLGQQWKRAYGGNGSAIAVLNPSHTLRLPPGLYECGSRVITLCIGFSPDNSAPAVPVPMAREFYENIVPNHTVYEVDCPDHWWRRFTNDGQYLICFCKTYHDLLIYRPLWPTFASTLDTDNEVPARVKKFDSYFSLLYQVPLARDSNEVICKDFFLSTENNLYGIFATSTVPDPNAPAVAGGLPGVPSVEKITFLVVRFADGAVTGRYVFKDDFIHLALNAGVFLHENLLSILSIRYQRIHILQIREGGHFLDVRVIGDYCREDDELVLNSQAQSEAKFQEEQALLRKARGQVSEAEVLASAAESSKARRTRSPCTTLIDRKRPRHRDSRAAQDDFGTSWADLGESDDRARAAEIDILYDGYFRGLFTGVNRPVAVGVNTSNGHARGSSSNQHSSDDTRTFYGETGTHTSLHGRRIANDGDQYNYEISSGRRFLAAMPERGRRVVRRTDHETSAGRPLPSTGSLYNSSDIASQSYTSQPGPSSQRGEFGLSESWMRPVPSMSASGRSMAAPQNRRARDEVSLGDPSAGLSRHSLEGGDQATSGTRSSRGRLGQTSEVSVGRRGGTPTETAAAPVDVIQDGGQILRGIKQRLLSFILQGIQNGDVTPAVKAQQLKRFYYHFQHYVDLVMWKVQFLDRCHLLIKFGSVDGVVQKNSEASHQTAFLAVYNMETTEILSFYQNSSEELLQLVERYWDHFRVVPQNPLYMNFISSYSNNPFAREQLRKQRIACFSGKGGSYTQAIKRTLASVPHNSQSLSPSAYFDQYLFHYDEKLISSTDRHKPCAEHPIKFISRRRPNSLKFKINPGLELDSNDGHIKRVASFLFHPIYPFVISVQQSFMQSSVVNFHFRR